MTTLLIFLFWILVWWLVGLAPIVCTYLFDKSIERATVEDIAKSVTLAFFGPFVSVMYLCFWISDNGNKVVLEKKKKFSSTEGDKK